MISFRWWLLLLLYLFFLLMGTLVFMHFEGRREDAEIDAQRFLKQKISRFMMELENSTTMQATKEIITEIGDDCGTNYLDTTSEKIKLWSLWNTFFFTFTVITTIGYGHMSPGTINGRLFTIGYSLIGIPINGILFSLLAEYYLSRLMKIHKKSQELDYETYLALFAAVVVYLIPGILLFFIFPAIIFSYVEDWDFASAVYYTFVTLTTIGFGDLVAGHPASHTPWSWLYRIGIFIWIVFGLGYLFMIVGFIQKSFSTFKVKKVEKVVSKVLNKKKETLYSDMLRFKRILATIDVMKPHGEIEEIVRNDSSLKHLRRASSQPNIYSSKGKNLEASASSGEKSSRSSRIGLESEGLSSMLTFLQCAEAVLENQSKDNLSRSQVLSELQSNKFNDYDLRPNSGQAEKHPVSPLGKCHRRFSLFREKISNATQNFQKLSADNIQGWRLSVKDNAETSAPIETFSDMLSVVENVILKATTKQVDVETHRTVPATSTYEKRPSLSSAFSGYNPHETVRKFSKLQDTEKPENLISFL